MLNAYERQLIFSYLSNAASRFHHTSQQEALAEWVAENSDILALNDENEALSKQREIRRAKGNYPSGSGIACGKSLKKSTQPPAKGRGKTA